ncbi:MAG: T9SS type A sorting domain-containing protein [Ignavibacteria bacterium]|nr:T9SS type A sorting domain-containing protein [Ignavibacteria bacterium]
MKDLQRSLLMSAFALMIAMLFLTAETSAQTPQYYNYQNVGAANNNFPFGMSSGKAANWLFLPGEFAQPSPCPAGNKITKIYFWMSTGGAPTYSNLIVLMAKDTVTSIPAGTFYSGPMDTVYFKATASLTGTTGSWASITLDKPYSYDPSKSLIVFVGQCGMSGSGWTIKQNVLTGNRRTWSVGACPFSPYSGGDASMPDFGVDVTPETVIPTGTWTEQVSGLTTSLNSVSAVDDNIAWACGNSGKVVRTTNKGQTWTNVSGTISATYSLYCVYAYDANNAIVTGVASPNTSIFQTTNGGATWTTANTHTGFGDDIYMSDANNAYFIGDPSGGNWDLLKSTNGGLNWGTWSTLPTTNTSGTYNNAAWFQGTQVWFPNVGLSQMMYSSNMGANWTAQTIPLSEITATCFVSPTRGLAGGSSTSIGLLSTTDAGTTWSSITAPLPTTSIMGIAGASTSWWIAMQDTMIHYSSNDGASWTTQYAVPAGSFYHLTKSRSGATLWGVRSNGGISRFGTAITAITPVANGLPVNYSLSQNYPNPFNPVTKINYALPKSGFVTLKIYDILGRQIVTLINETKNAGDYSVDFNASSLNSGVYFYRLEANGFSDTKKMLLIK